MYEVLAVEAGLASPDSTFVEKILTWLKVQLIAELFNHTALAAVKLALLLFFKPLGRNVNRFDWLWWSVVASVLLFYIISVGTMDFRCYIPTLEDIEGYCSSRPAADFNLAVLKVTCAFDVVSDFLSML
jgi:hypothetical protein